MLLPARETLKKVTALWRSARRRHAPMRWRSSTQPAHPVAQRDLQRNVTVWYVTAADVEEARASAIHQALVTQAPIIVKVVSDETYHSLLLEDQDHECLVDEY